jgi:hypothetical protein
MAADFQIVSFQLIHASQTVFSNHFDPGFTGAVPFSLA